MIKFENNTEDNLSTLPGIIIITYYLIFSHNKEYLLVNYSVVK